MSKKKDNPIADARVAIQNIIDALAQKKNDLAVEAEDLDREVDAIADGIAFLESALDVL